MIKTLKIATFLVGALTLGGFAIVIFFSLQPNTTVQEFLSTKGEVEKFIASSTAPKANESPDSPLVTQAEAFALRLDPPPPPAPIEPEPSVINPEITRQAPPSTAFTLAGTVISNNPQYSLALLDTTAKGMRWYRQNDKIGRQTIEQILSDRIVVSDGEKKYEMMVPPKQKISLLKGDPNNPYTNTKVNPYGASPLSGQENTEPAAPAVSAPVVETPKMTAEMVKENIDFLTQLANDPNSMGMSKEEAAQLGDMSELVEQLKKEAAEINSEANQPPQKAAEMKSEANQPPQKTATPTPTPTPAERRGRRAR